MEEFTHARVGAEEKMTPVVPLPTNNTTSLEHVPASEGNEVRRRSITRRLLGAAIDRLVLTAMIREDSSTSYDHPFCWIQLVQSSY